MVWEPITGIFVNELLFYRHKIVNPQTWLPRVLYFLTEPSLAGQSCSLSWLSSCLSSRVFANRFDISTINLPQFSTRWLRHVEANAIMTILTNSKLPTHLTLLWYLETLFLKTIFETMHNKWINDFYWRYFEMQSQINVPKDNAPEIYLMSITTNVIMVFVMI